MLLRLGGKKKLQMVATSDVGEVAAQAFMHADAEEFKNKSISLAGDELNFSEMKEVFEKKTGEKLPVTYVFVARMLHWMSSELGYMFKWFRDVGFGVDVAGLGKKMPGMKNFRTWLETESAWKKA